MNKNSLAMKLKGILTHPGSIKRNARFKAAKEYGLPVRQARKSAEGKPFTFDK